MLPGPDDQHDAGVAADDSSAAPETGDADKPSSHSDVGLPKTSTPTTGPQVDTTAEATPEKEKEDDVASMTPSELLKLKKEAAEGSESDQLKLGQYYLNLSDLGHDPEENGRVGVDWLMQASRQGNEEATDLLRQCVDRGIGVNEDNIDDVQWCIETPQLEKLGRQAAKTLFRAINPLHTRTVSKEVYLERVTALGSDKVEINLLKKAAKKSDDGEISEDVFVAKMMKRFQGGGHLNAELGEVEQKAYQNATLWQKTTKYTGKTVRQSLNYVVDTAGQQGLTWVKSIIPTRQVYALLIFYIYGLLTSQILMWIMPLMVFYISLVTMITATLQMFYAQQKLKDVKTMVGLLKRFNHTLDSESAASQFTWNSMTPYWLFFGSLAVMVMSLAMSDRNLIPCSELSLLSAFMTVACLAALSDKYDWLTFVAISLEVLSTMPAILQTLPRVPYITSFATAFVGIWFSVPLAPNLYLQFGFPVLAYMVVPLLFLRMAMKMSWQGTYRVLIPHLICFFWWQICVIFFQYSTWIGLVRSTVGWILLIVLLPVFIVIGVIYIVYYFSSLFTLTNLLRIFTTVALLAIPTALIFWGKSGFKVKGFSLQGKSAKSKAVLVLIFALSVIPFVFVGQGSEKDTSGEYVTWEQYKRFCSKPRWEETNMAESMITCSHFSYLMAQWNGTVNKIVVKSLDNQAESFINLFPWSISEWLRCTYGIEYPDCDAIEEPVKKDLCEITTLQNRKCSLENLNRYTFEVWVQIPVDEEYVHDVRIEASHKFQETLMKIKAGDEISFRGLLLSDLGNKWPQLKLYYVECTTCPLEAAKIVSYGTKGIIWESLSFWEHLVSAVQQTWNFFLAPVLEFHMQPRDPKP